MISSARSFCFVLIFLVLSVSVTIIWFFVILNQVQTHNRHYRATTEMKPSHYAVKRLKTLPSNFLELASDEGTKEFLREAKARRSAVKDSIATVLKRTGYSLTDANGIVD